MPVQVKLSRISKYIFALFISAFSLNSFADEIVITKGELRALMAGGKGAMERLGAPNWIELAQEDQNGCWLTNKKLVREGASAKFEGVPMTCVSNGLIHIFFPTRLKKACDRVGASYDIL